MTWFLNLSQSLMGFIHVAGSAKVAVSSKKPGMVQPWLADIGCSHVYIFRCIFDLAFREKL